VQKGYGYGLQVKTAISNGTRASLAQLIDMVVAACWTIAELLRIQKQQTVWICRVV